MFDLICWNARGVGNRHTSTHLQSLLVHHKPHLLILIEPKIGNDRPADFARRMGFSNHAQGEEICSRIWLLWNGHISVQNLMWHKYQVTASITVIFSNFSTLCTFVHAPCSVAECQVLWDEIVDLHGHT